MEEADWPDIHVQIMQRERERERENTSESGKHGYV
jgi:hypothetical protein